MNADFGFSVIDWFTKKRKMIISPETCETEFTSLLNQLGQVFAGKNLAVVADNVSKTLERSDFFKEVCSDPDNPVCGMYYHAKTTAGLAACIAYDQIRSDEDFIQKSLAQYDVSAESYSEKDFIGLVRLGALFRSVVMIGFYEFPWQPPEQYGDTPEKIILSLLRIESVKSFAARYQLEKILPVLSNPHPVEKSDALLNRLVSMSDTISAKTNRAYDLTLEQSGETVTVTSHDPVFPHIIDFNAEKSGVREPHGAILLGFEGTTTASVGTLGSKELGKPFFRDVAVEGGLPYYSPDAKKIRYSFWDHEQNPLKIGYLALDIKRIQEFINEADNLRMLRGGSTLVEDILSDSRKKIAGTLSDECVIFAGGGNLLSLLPSDPVCRENLKKSIAGIISEKSQKALSAGIVTGDVSLQEFGENFSEVLKKIQEALDKEKQAADTVPILKPLRHDAICPFCNKRIANGAVSSEKAKGLRMCSACAKKWSRGKRLEDDTGGKSETGTGENDLLPRELMNEENLHEPDELSHLGSSIAVITVDGNMMGRLFLSTHSPAEYAYKSATFDKAFKTTLKKTIEDYVREDLKRISLVKDSRVRFQPQGKGPVFLAIRPIFGGGDDLLIITSARAAIPISKKIITAIAECFMFETNLPNEGRSGADAFKNPTVTVSAGIAIAQSGFPVYFVIEQARKMEGEAKTAFRKSCLTDNHSLIRFPLGSLAFTAISGAMPSGEGLSFVIRSGSSTGAHENLDAVIDVLDKSLDASWKRTIADIVTSYDTKEDLLNLLMSTYASAKRRGVDEGTKITLPEQLERAEYLATMFTPAHQSVLKAAKMVVPHVWHSEEEV